MKQIPITAKLGDGEPVTVDFDMPEDLEEMSQEWGAEGVYNQARQNVVVAVQGRMRTMMKEDRKGGPASQEEIQEMADKFEVGKRKPAKSKTEKIKETFAQLDPELKKQLIASLREEQDSPAVQPQKNGPTGAKTAAKTASPATGKTAARPAQGQQATRPAQGQTRPAGQQAQRPTTGAAPQRTAPAGTRPAAKQPTRR